MDRRGWGEISAALERVKPATVAIALAIVVAGPSGPPLAANAPPEADADRYAERLGELVNQYRARQGNGALLVDGRLVARAREHSVHMAKMGHLSHDDFRSRVRRSGYGRCVENVGWNYRTPEAQLEGWRRSSRHDHNLLDARVKRIGIGIESGYVTFIACQ